MRNLIKTYHAIRIRQIVITSIDILSDLMIKAFNCKAELVEIGIVSCI